jgi:hypothetical protein
MTRKNKQKPQKSQKKKKNNNRSRRQQGMVVASQPQPTLGSIGGQLGTVAGNFLSKIFGMGSYKLRKNNIFDDLCNDQVPVMHSNSETVVLRHREYIADISTTTGFGQQQFSINPGLATTFPFLSAIAQNFQEYSFNGLVFEYKSTSADALSSTNTALGSIMMAAVYRADAGSFFNKQQLLNEMWSADAKPSESFLLPIECDPSENPLPVQYVRGTAVPSGQDTKLYDLATLTVASYGSQAASVVGELWATYEVVLRKPMITSGIATYGDSALFELVTPTNANMLGASRVQIMDFIGLTLTATSVTFPPSAQGVFLLCLSYKNGTGVTAAFTQPTLTNCSFVTVGGDNYFGSTGTGSTYSCTWVIVKIPNTYSAAIVAYSGFTIPVTPAHSELLVTQLPGGLPSY